LTLPRAVSTEDLERSPAWLPLDVQAGSVRLACLDERAYAAASFLDQRLLAMGLPAGTCAPPLLAAAARRLAPRAHFIFHTGHVGSTLISRLLGAYAGFFALREPALLRVLVAPASGAVDLPSLETALALFSRTWRPGERAVIKVTSFVSEMAPAILAADGEARALLLFTRPLIYLRTILGGPNSRLENQQLARARLARLVRRVPAGTWHENPASEGEWIASSWLCEMSALTQAGRGSVRVLWQDFDAFLADPRAALARILRGLGANPAAAEVEALVSGPLMRQYSKAPEHPYDTALRRSVLSAADAEHAAEIRRGMQWLERVTARHAPFAEVLQRSTREDS
jgi:hypothetical protein